MFVLSEHDLRVFPNLETLSHGVAVLFSDLVKEKVHERGEFLLVLSGGSTPQMLYRLLSAPPHSTNIPWKKIHFFWGDERCVPPQSNKSNFKQAHQLLLSKVNVLDENVHRIKGELEPENAARDYQQTLTKVAPNNRTYPRFDLVFLGLGSDGHTASLFPGKMSPLETQEPVIAVKGDYQGRPANRVTLTPIAINNAANVMFLVSGKDKAKALKETITGDRDLKSLPAQRIQPSDGNLMWIVDKAAASEL